MVQNIQLTTGVQSFSQFLMEREGGQEKVRRVSVQVCGLIEVSRDFKSVTGVCAAQSV